MSFSSQSSFLLSPMIHSQNLSVFVTFTHGHLKWKFSKNSDLFGKFIQLFQFENPSWGSYQVHCCYVHVCFIQVTTCGAPRCADAPRCTHFTTVISPSWIIEQISLGKWSHRGASARRERQTSFKIVTWTKQTWKKHHNLTWSRPRLVTKDFSTWSLRAKDQADRFCWDMMAMATRNTRYVAKSLAKARDLR